MTFVRSDAVAVAIGTSPILVGFVHEEAGGDVSVLPLTDDEVISEEFVVVPASQVIALKAWPRMDDGHPMLLRTGPVKISDEPGGKTRIEFAGYQVMYVPEEHLSSPPGTIVVARTFVNDLALGAPTVQGITTHVDIGKLIAPQDLAERLERRRTS